jgi:queuine tRNA-ribosyltransferase
VKAIYQHELTDIAGAEIILGNTYHLYLRPGTDIISKAGGLQKFISWNKPMLTDSGGYQVYSLSQARKIKEEGVTFQSHIDGSRHQLNPENTIYIQRKIGADIIMAFDECTPYPCEKDYARQAMERTHRWLDRCIVAFDKSNPEYDYDQVLAPIVQGSVYPDLREISAEYIAGKDMEINAIGGLSVGEPHEDMYAMTELCCSILPEDKPRYLMGVGKPENLLECISRGIDMFDCVLPTRNARHGILYTPEGILRMKNKKWESDFSPIDASGISPYSLQYSKAYLRHLFTRNEILALQIASVHNICFYMWLVTKARNQIIRGSFSTWKDEMMTKITHKL